MILCPQNRMSDTNDLTKQLPTMPGTDGCAPSVDDGNDVTPLMHKVSVQEASVNKMTGVAVWHSVGASFARQPAAPPAPQDPRSSGAAGSSIFGLLEVVESDLLHQEFGRSLPLKRTRLRTDTRRSHKRTM